MKDNFSQQSKAYSAFRPSYPEDAFHYILSFVENKTTAWDCGTGNGQLAAKLADYFQNVYATDISKEQIANAIQKENIHYMVSDAENADFSENQFDLITVAQAIHWFDFDKFYKRVKHTLKSNGILAVIGYDLLKIDAKTDPVISRLHSDILGQYWDSERRYIDEHYETIPFPFEEVGEKKNFAQALSWSKDELIGYLNTWSAVQHYIKANNQNPVEQIKEQLDDVWGSADKKIVAFPTLLRIGKN